jgi:hypothetical protein
MSSIGPDSAFEYNDMASRKTDPERENCHKAGCYPAHATGMTGL